MGTVQQSLPENTTGEIRVARLAGTGDRTAFDRLVMVFGAPLRGFLGRRIAQGSVDDVVQETFLAAWMGLPRYKPRLETTFGMWLYRIARHKAADWARSNARKTAREAAITPADEEQIAAPTLPLSVETDTEIAYLIQTLSPEQQELLELYYAQELTLAEIATRQQRNLSTVKYHFYRTQDALIKARLVRKEASQ